jgi:hypothetical protein
MRDLEARTAAHAFAIRVFAEMLRGVLGPKYDRAVREVLEIVGANTDGKPGNEAILDELRSLLLDDDA